jgi:hypothetical protein
MPDGAEPVKGAVLVLSAEDGLADTIRPRLDAAGGDPDRVITITEIAALTEDGEPVTRPVSLPGDLPAIRQVITRNRVVLVIVDVLMAYLSGTVNSHRDQDVRRALHPLAVMAGQAGCCVLVIRHLNKSSDQHAIYRGGGSIGIVGAARAAFMVGADPEDETGSTRVLAAVKCNLARRPPALAYRLAGDAVNDCVRVQWLGPSDRRAADLLAASDDAAREERGEHNEAADWLQDYLTDHGGEAEWKDIRKAARADGIAERTLQRSHRKAGVVISRRGFGQGSVWSLSAPHWRHPRQETPIGGGGADGVNGGDATDGAPEAESS